MINKNNSKPLKILKKTISGLNWPRQTHFEFFKSFDLPQYGMTAKIEVSEALALAKSEKISFYGLCLFVITKTLNEIPEFRQRIQGDEAVEYERTHISFTVLNENKIFNFCFMEFQEDFSQFLQEFQKISEQGKNLPYLNLEDDFRDDVNYLSCVPWIPFTSVSHPMANTGGKGSEDAIPRVSWGKYEKEGEAVFLPVGIQVNHALVDGVHLGQFYQTLQRNFKHIGT